MSSKSRFERPSSTLQLKSLIVKTRKIFWVSLIIAIGVHGILTQVGFTKSEGSVIKPLTTKFIKREPRLAKPLELKKRPAPKPRPMRRKMIAVKAKVSRRDFVSSAPPLRVLDSLAKPRGGIVRTVSFEPAPLEGYFGSMLIEGDKEPEQKVDMRLEMVDIDALDTGKYDAMVIQDPRDKKKIKGFFHLVVVYSENMAVEEAGHHFPDIQGVFNLVKKINQWSGIEADVRESIPLSSPNVLKVPWIFITTHFPFKLRPGESENLGKYILSGGFAFVDDCNNSMGSPSDICLRNMVKDALATQGFEKGKDWNFETLSAEHPIFHCFFDFNSIPRGCVDMGQPYKHPQTYSGVDGVVIDGRLVILYSNRDYGCDWSEWWSGDPTNSYKFGVNSIIFALTQEGSITHQAMHYVE